MQGSRSEAVDERGRSLVMDHSVGVSAPAWWRRMAVDGGGWGGDGVLAQTVYEWENEGRGMGNNVFGTRLSEIWENYELSPHLKFQTSRRLGIGW